MILAPWHEMTTREQLVWAAAYVANIGNPVDAIRLANHAVQTLRELDLDNRELSRPEYYAAQHGPGLTFEEFRAWYPIALKIAKKGVVAPDEITEAAYHRAFDVYQRCSTDFY